MRNSTLLDYETNPEFHLIVAAQTEHAASSVFAFANLTIRLTNQNDNSPLFTQERYFASVLEGINKGTYVIEVSFSLPLLVANYVGYTFTFLLAALKV